MNFFKNIYQKITNINNNNNNNNINNIMNSKITINGTTYYGDNVVVNGNNQIIIDGKSITCDDKEISIHVEGDVNSVQSTNAPISINGNVKQDVKTTNGGATCIDIFGNVTTINGDLTCHTLKGNFISRNGDLKDRL